MALYSIYLSPICYYYYYRGFGVLGFWGFGVLGFWGFGVLGFWGFGVLGFWGAGEEEREIRGILLQIVHILADKCLGWIERQKNIIQLFEKIWVTNIALESIKSEPQEKLSNRYI